MDNKILKAHADANEKLIQVQKAVIALPVNDIFKAKHLEATNNMLAAYQKLNISLTN